MRFLPQCRFGDELPDLDPDFCPANDETDAEGQAIVAELRAILGGSLQTFQERS